MGNNSLNKIVLLSGTLAAGFLLIILSCAIYSNWKPLIDVAIFLIAPLPNAMCGSGNSYDDLLSGGNANSLAEFGQYVTGFLVVSGLALPLVLYHSHLIEFYAMLMSTAGGLIIYASIITFGMFFQEEEDDYMEF
ncbi:hypothetical protein BABINDRAFT_9796 [Babjeviella inositovora NRRL Y-12698]|uniref:Vacuolar protein sorting-associated protein 55 n=1 Tax=Babjeviella inositovora NRRL Y-12698 TaxID=984486 RepID=A0A1E3QJG1_9ASCO|nr:uncharacterized protein BABINDRAFT_9796 [Babjeviella inositovora NRRL Y-12698]ODQ77809.1 hypothetical protein BABINDRAFT_9796 [Babjeviella inositovora NRRL Y-12698]